MISQSRIRELLDYDEESGVFTWLLRRGGIKAGSIAGHKHKHGYVEIKIDGNIYQAHRIAWLLTYGDECEFIDHINHNRADNRLVNLRSVSRSDNARNKSKYNSNTSGVTGVVWNATKKRWIAQIGIDGEVIHLGTFTKHHLAVDARKLAEVAYGFHENHGKQ